MRMTIWQFVGLIAVLGLAYVVYEYWWVDQDRESWINRFNDSVYESEDELAGEPEPEKKKDDWL